MYEVSETKERLWAQWQNVLAWDVTYVMCDGDCERNVSALGIFG